jgi:hypothetical protein
MGEGWHEIKLISQLTELVVLRRKPSFSLLHVLVTFTLLLARLRHRVNLWHSLTAHPWSAGATARAGTLTPCFCSHLLLLLLRNTLLSASTAGCSW